MKQKKVKQSLVILIKKRKSLRRLLTEITPILRGSVVTLGIKCGNPNCKCARGETHPSVYFSISKKGKTRMVYLGKKVQSQAEEWVDNYKKFKKIVDQLTEVNLEILRYQRKKRKKVKNE